MSKLLILDLETTGLKPPNAEILQVGIIDINGNVLMNQYVKPKADKWIDAERIHGITPAMVVNCPTLESITTELCAITKDAHIMIYNAQYDLQFLPSIMVNGFNKTTCLMLAYSKQMREWDYYWGHWKWHKLTVAAENVGHDWNAHKAHDAIGDCFATLSVYKWLKAQKELERVTQLKDMELVAVNYLETVNANAEFV